MAASYSGLSLSGDQISRVSVERKTERVSDLRKTAVTTGSRKLFFNFSDKESVLIIGIPGL